MQDTPSKDASTEILGGLNEKVNPFLSGFRVMSERICALNFLPEDQRRPSQPHSLLSHSGISRLKGAWEEERQKQ